MIQEPDSVATLGSVFEDPRVIASGFQAIGSIVAALLIGIAGGLISKKYARERDAQDKESQWRDHAVELTKLDLERKLQTRTNSVTASEEKTNAFSPSPPPPPSPQPIRPSILDFLANYRDLKELDFISPKELYIKIRDQRISTNTPADRPPIPTALSPEIVRPGNEQQCDESAASIPEELDLILRLAGERLGWHHRCHHSTREISGIYGTRRRVLKRVEQLLQTPSNKSQ